MNKATADTVDLSPPHAPKEESIIAFDQVLPELKHELVRLRHDHDSKNQVVACCVLSLALILVLEFEPEYFAAVVSYILLPPSADPY
jgi:hypothetical protein